MRKRRRTFFPHRLLLLSLIAFIFPVSGLAQDFLWSDVSPGLIYIPPGDPSCTAISVQDSAYQTVDLEVYYPSGEPQIWWQIPLDENGQFYFCIDESWQAGQYVITGIQYYGWYYFSTYAPFDVNPAPPPTNPPVVYAMGPGCDNWDCVWATGIRFYPDSRVVVYSTNWASTQTYYGPAWQQWPPLDVNPEGTWLAFQVQDANLRQSFGWDGLYVMVVNNDGTDSGWHWAQSPVPAISSGVPSCADLYCVTFTGVFPLNAYVDFRVPGSSEILPNAYTDLVVTPAQITLRLNPSVHYAYNISGLNAWVVNPAVFNGSSAYYLPPVDRNVTGYIDDVFPVGNQYYIRGWACAKTHPGSIDVHVYVGGTAGGGGTLVFSGTADQSNEPAVTAACNSTSSNHRFYLPIPHWVTQNYGGQPLYVHGISPLGLEHLSLNNGGVFYVPSIDRSITGWVEGISGQGQNQYLYGWACARTYSGSIDVHVYAGGPAGAGTFVFSGTANQPSDGGIASACNSTGSNHRFSLLIPQTVRDQYAGQPLYAHGISPYGLEHLLLNNSGMFTIPAMDRSITGWVSSISLQGPDAYLLGWACAKTYPGSIYVQVYVGGPAGSGALAFTGTANQPSESAVAEACDSTGSNYRFALLIPPSVRSAYAGFSIHVHGISPFGLPNLLLNGPGIIVPGTASMNHREYIYIGDRLLAVEAQ